MALPVSGIKLVAEIAEYNSAIDSVIKRANDVDSLTPTVKVQANDQELDSTVKKVAALDSESATVKVNTDDSEVKETESLLKKIGDSPIVVSLAVAGGAVATVTGILGAVGVGGIVEYDNALAKIQGRTGQMIPDAKELISNLYTSGWGESRDEIADVIIQANNLGIEFGELEEATRKAFEVAGATGLETNEVLRAMDTLVKNDLVNSYTEAADVIVTGFQEGANRGDDLLDTFNEYGSTFKQVGISGEGALSLINSGLNAGVDNSDRIADAIRETGIRLGELGTNPDIANAFKQLDRLSDIDLAGNFKAYQAGEMSGDEFFEGFFQALEDAATKDPAKAQTIAATLVGTISEDFGVESISQLSTKWDTTMGVLEGRAAEGGAAISDTLGASIQGFVRSAEEAAIDFLSSEQIDLPGKIAALKDGLQGGLTALQADGDLSNALSIALKPLGFDDEFKGLESMLGNFVIAILQAVSTLQSLNPDTWAAKAGTDATIANLATQQLTFDLQVGNPDEVAGEIQTAVSRGVSPDKIAETVGTAVSALIEKGQPAVAQSLLNAVKSAQEDANANVQLTASGSLMNTEALLTGQNFEALQEKITAAQEAVELSVDPIDTYTQGLNTLTGKTTAAQQPVTTYTAKVQSSGTQAAIAAPKITGVGTAASGAGNAAAIAAPQMDGLGGTINNVASSGVAATDSLTALNEKLQIIVATAGDVAAAADALANAPRPPTGGGGGGTGSGTTPTPSEFAEGGVMNGLSWVGEEGPELISSDTSLAVLNNRTSEAIIAAMQPYIPGGSYRGGGNTNIINNTNFLPNIPVADALGFRQAQTLRGMN